MVDKTNQMIANGTNAHKEKTAIKNKTTVNIVGSCVSREIFNRKKGNEYDVKAYIHRNSIFTFFFNVHPDYKINEPEVSKVSPHGFARRMMCTTLNSDGPEQLLARKGEWIVIDTYYSSQLCAVLGYPEGNNRILQYDTCFAHCVNETLKNNIKFKNCSFEPVDASVNMTYYIEEVARFLKKNWGNKIILINLPLAFIELNEDGILQRDATIQMDWQQRSNKMVELLINRIDCQYITIPAVAVRDYWLNRDHINVHYVAEIYDFLKESVDSIINGDFLDYRIHNKIIAKYDLIIGNILLGNWASEKNTLARVDAMIKGKTNINSERTVSDCFKLVEQKNPLGYGSLARLYREGKGVEKDLDKAIEWMRRAADCRIEWARFELFDLLWRRSNSDDLIEMKTVAEEYAREGNADSMLRLGRMYRDGKGVEKDLDKAIDMMRKTAEKIQGWSRNELVDMLWKRGTPEDFEEMKSVAETAAGEGDIGAMGRLGRMYRDGKGVEKDLDKAIEWMRKAAEKNPIWNREIQELIE